MNQNPQHHTDEVVRFLGTISVCCDGDETEPGPLAANLLLSLALAPGRSQSAAALIADIWDEEAGLDKRPALQTLVSRLRAQAGTNVIVTRTGGYALTELNDLDRATEILGLAKASGSDPGQSLALCDEALGMWRGRIGVGASNEELVEELGITARDLRRELRAVRAMAAIELGHVEDVLGDVRELCQQSPYDDTVTELLMRALHLSGRTNEALETYAEYRARLAEELGSHPTAKLDAFHLALLQENDHPKSGLRPIRIGAQAGEAPGETVAQPAGSGPVRIGLKTAPNPLIGRADDLRRLTQRLTESRLVTIQGPGGIGKTRLAHEVANEASGRGLDVAIVELAGLRSGSDIAAVVASTLGVHEIQPPIGTTSQSRSRLVEMLDDRPTLLVIDNCEHVSDGAAQWIAEVLAQTTRLRIVTTSRATLGIAAERIYLVDALPATDAQGGPGPAVELFEARAHAARPGTSLNAGAVIRLCERLDGLPLAIELAAARTRVMSVEEILERLTDRFVLLTSGDRTAPQRHQTLTAVIEWSWDLLTARQRRLGGFLGVFPDGFTSAGAAQVAAGQDQLAILDDLEALVAQSLLRVENGADGRTRYRMLETVREFTLGRLSESGEQEPAHEAFLDWARTLAQRLAVDMDGDDQERVFAEAGEELENVLAAMRIAAHRGDPRTVVGCYSMIGTWWAVRGAFGELASFNGLVMNACADYNPEPEDAQYAVVVFALTELMLLRVGTMRDVARARICLRRALGRAASINPTFRVLGEVALHMASQDKMIEVARRGTMSLDTKEGAVSHLVLSLIMENAGDIAGAIEMAVKARDLASDVNHQWMRAMAAQSISGLNSQTNQPAIALRWALTAQADYLRLGAETPNGEIEQLLAFGYLASADYPEARASFNALRALGELGSPELKLVADIGLAEVDRMTGEVETALAAYRDLSARTRFRADPAMRPWHMIIDAATIAVHVLESDVDRPELAVLVRDLAQEFLGSEPPPRNAIDFPVLGSVLVAISAWQTYHCRANGAELLALAEAFSSRQDFPALVRDKHFEALASAAQVNSDMTNPAAAREAVAGFDLAQNLLRANELLASVVAGDGDGLKPSR